MIIKLLGTIIYSMILLKCRVRCTCVEPVKVVHGAIASMLVIYFHWVQRKQKIA